MDYILLLFLLFPITWLVIAKWWLHKTFSWFEFIITCLIIIACASLFYYTGKYSATQDTEILNGEVTKKYNRTESCPSGWNDYQDDFCSEYRTRTVRDGEICSTDSEGRRSCVPKYKTQYNYIYDWEKRWYVTTTFDTHQITRLDPQGVKEPNRWTAAYVGEPASTTHNYTNWVQAAPDSLFNSSQGTQYIESIPPYPMVFDLYKTRHAINYKSKISKDILDSINLEIGNILRTDGGVHQVHVIVVITDEPDQSIRYAFERKWIGGKKNNIVVFVGRNADNTIKWVDVMTWAKNHNNELLQVSLRNNLMDNNSIEPTLVAKTIQKEIRTNYKRPEMKDFEYLKARIQPPTWILWIVGFICFVFPIGLTYFFHKNNVDPFSKNKYNY